MIDIKQMREYLRPALDYPEIPYHILLKESVRKYPEKDAIVFKGQRISFRELDALSNGFANALKELGVEPGDRIALYMTNRPEYVISFYAAAKIAAVITPMNPSYKEHEVEHQAKDSEAKVLITTQALSGVARAATASLPHVRIIVVGDAAPEGAYLFRDLVQSHSTRAPEFPAIRLEEHLIALPYSSGTTGLPKGVMLTHRNLVVNNIQCMAAGKITPQDVLLIFLPFYHIYGTMLMGVSVASGATMVIMEGFNLEESLWSVEEYGVTLYYAVPPILLALTQYPDIQKRKLSSLRYIMVGAAPVPPEVAKRVKDLAGIHVIQGYGLTEASPLTHLNPMDPRLARIDSAGFSVSDQLLKIVDVATGERELPAGEVGEIIVFGPHVMKGYWKAPEETARTIRNGWLYTGDIGRLDEEGYLYIVDRKKEMIKYKGFGVAPAEIEAVLFEHPAIADCAVFAKQDPEAGEIPKGVVILKPGQTATAEDIIEFVGQRLAGYKKVREIEFVSEIPKNPSGKILRRMLIERERAKLQAAAG
jgi:long-chain acyl-CoA synthetase